METKDLQTTLYFNEMCFLREQHNDECVSSKRNFYIHTSITNCYKSHLHLDEGFITTTFILKSTAGTSRALKTEDLMVP